MFPMGGAGASALHPRLEDKKGFSLLRFDFAESEASEFSELQPSAQLLVQDLTIRSSHRSDDLHDQSFFHR